MHIHLDRRAASLTAVEAPEDYLFAPGDLAGWLGVSLGTLKRWRRLGKGPTCCRAGLRAIRYRKSDVLDWLRSRSIRFEPTAKAEG